MNKQKSIIWSSVRLEAFLTAALFALSGCMIDDSIDQETASDSNKQATASGESALGSDPISAEGVLIENEQDLNLLARVDLASQAVMKFYEPEPGALLIIESGRIDSQRDRSADEDRLDAKRVYESLSNRPAPQALVDAVERSKAAAASRQRSPRSTETPTIPEPAPMTKTLYNDRTHDSFVNYYCIHWGDVQANWIWVTGYGNTGTWSDKNQLWSNALAVAGEIRHVVRRRPWYTWQDVSRVFVSEGWYNAIQYINNTVDFDTNVYIDNADGDTYDACTQAG